MPEVSKLGVHINAVTNHSRMLEFFRVARPRVATMIDHYAAYDFVVAAKEVSPQTLWIGRKYTKEQPLDHPIQRAREHGQRIMDSRLSQVITTWCGYNEIAGYPYVPNVGSEKILAFFAFERELANFLHRYEKQYAGGKWSVGNPDYQWWGYPEMRRTVQQYYDILILHEYCAPTMNDLRSFDPPPAHPEIYIESGHYCLRYRQVMRLLGSLCPPIVIGECGIDSLAPSTWHADTPDPGKHYGWKQFTDVAGYMAQLAWYDRQLRKDQKVIGACIYCFGTEDPKWDSFDLLGPMVDRLAVYNATSHHNSQLSKADIEDLVGEHAQQHIIPYYLEAAFDKYRKRVGGIPTGWEARSKEVDYRINEYLTIRYQVYVEGAMQHIVCARVGHDKAPLTVEGAPATWEAATWHFDRVN